MPYKALWALALTGGGTGAVDKIPTANIADKYMIHAITPTLSGHYSVDADSAAAESSPWVIQPDNEEGDKRAVLVDFVAPNVYAKLFKAYDTDFSHSLSLKWNEDSAADRILNLLVNEGDRTLDLAENLKILDGQDIELHASGGEKAQLAIDTQNAERTLDLSENLTVADGYNVTLQALGQANSLILNESLTVGDGYPGTLTFSAESKVLTVDESETISNYHTDARAATWLAAGHETTYNHANYDTAYDWGDHAGLYELVGISVLEADYNAHTILAATTDDTPVALTVGEQTLVGRITSGNIAALTTTQVRTLLNVADGAQVCNFTNVNAALAAADAAIDVNSQNLTGVGTINALTLAAAETGFTIAGGTTPKTLTLDDNFVVSTQLSAISANTEKVTNATHTGEVTGATELTIATAAVTLAKMANMATASFIGRTTAGVGVPEILSKANALSILNVADGADVTGSNAPQAHTASHAVGGADTIFPADPGADKFLMWDDSESLLSWQDATAVSAINDLTDVTITGPADLDLLQYDNGSSKWVDRSLSEAGIQPLDATLTSLADLGTAANKMLYTTDVDTWAEAAITAAGRSMVAGANAAAQLALLSGYAGAAFDFNGQNITVGNLYVPDDGFVGISSNVGFTFDSTLVRTVLYPGYLHIGSSSTYIKYGNADIERVSSIFGTNSTPYVKFETNKLTLFTDDDERLELGDDYGTTGDGKVNIYVADQNFNNPALAIVSQASPEPFIKFHGYYDDGEFDGNLTEESDVTTATRIGWFRIEIKDGSGNMDNGDYYVPYYTLE